MRPTRKCVAAAQLANADDFIRRLPDGYDTVIDGDGGSLSQGQRQLLSIARAAVADPPVMILDEATSSIDTRTESIVQARHGRSHVRTYGVRYRAPPVHDSKRRRYYGAGSSVISSSAATMSS